LLRSIAINRTPIQGMTDHYTHEAIYLPDAEGNGIELAWDFPREKWQPLIERVKREGIDAMLQFSGPLDPGSVLSELNDDTAPWEGLSADTKVGHVHLHVSALPATRHFYNKVLGFDTMMDSERLGATFFSAGGYHHHIGTNIWQGAGAPPPPPNATGLRYFSVVLPDQAELEQAVERIRRAGIDMEQTEQGILLRDPARNGVLLTVEPASR
jgi:catechol 2,3-dioxygenase